MGGIEKRWRRKVKSRENYDDAGRWMEGIGKDGGVGKMCWAMTMREIVLC